jgi:hypothetical protein
MMVFNPHSIDIRNMTSFPSSPSSLPTRRSQQKQKQKQKQKQNQKQKQRKETSGGLNNDPLGLLQNNNRRAALEQQARAFFKLTDVCDRKESHNRYNSHGNRGSFHHDQKQNNKLYRNVFAGSEAIDSMVGSGLAPSREKALQLGNRLASELNLFSRANPPHFSSSGHHTKPKRKARTNLLAAQTILLGASESESPENLLDVTVGATDLATTLAEGCCFADDTNAFYRFGPGVLSILRGIDHDCDLDCHPTKKGATETIETASTEETSFDSSNSDGDLEKKKKMNGKKQPANRNSETENRSLSIIPNAPGCSGKVVLEDLFMVRDPAMANNGNKPSKSSKKKIKKSAVIPHPSASIPPPLPKSILKNYSSTNDNNKKKKEVSSSKANKASRTKTKKAHKIKAGTKIKYISDKERRIELIQKGSSICHSEQQVVRHGQLLRELEKRISRVHTEDHFEIVSLSSHSFPRPNNQQRASTTWGSCISAEEPPLDNACCDDIEKDDCDDYDYNYDYDGNDAFDNALESLDDIISSNAGLLADGDDNASVWTEFIMGTSRDATEANANTKANEKTSANTKPKAEKTEAKIKATKKETRSSSTTPKATKLSKESPDKLRALPAVVENEEPDKKHRSVEQQQQQQQKNKKQTPTGWQAPAPLESGGGDNGSKNRNKARCNGKEIDLSSWAILNREKEGNESGEQRKNPCHPHRRLPSPLPLGSTKNDHGRKPSTIAMHNCTPDDISLLTPDDISLLLERQQEKEHKSLQKRDRGDGGVSKGHGGVDNNPSHHDNQTKTGPGNLASGAFLAGTKNYVDSTTGSVRSNVTKDSNDLARLRLMPRRIDGPDEKLPSLSEQEGITDGREGLYRDYHIRETNEKEADRLSSDTTPPTPISFDGDACNASDDDTSSGINEAIEQDPFFQQANFEAGIEAVKPQNAETKRNESAHAFDVSPLAPNGIPDHSDRGSFTEIYNDSIFFEASHDDFDGEEDTYVTYSDEGSYMELTVDDEEQSSEEIEEEVIEEEVIEEEIDEDQTFFEEITVVSESNRNYLQYHNTVSQPTVSPKRRTAKFQAARYLPSVPELGPEPEPEPEPQPTSPQRKQSVYVEVHSMPDDDEMTQITMDCFFSSSFRSNRSLHIIPEDDYTINNGDYTNHNSYLFPLKEGQEVTAGGGAIVSPLRTRDSRLMKNNLQHVPPLTPSTRYKNQFSAQQQLKQRTKQVASSAVNRHRNTVLVTETSQQRIQEILWKDLSSSDVTVVWDALEELRILVATESRSRAYLVRHGGVMIIIDTMATQLEVEVIQFLCCNILEQLASVDFEIGLTIMELGGISLIEQSMKKHAGSRRVKELGDVALATLSRNS